MSKRLKLSVMGRHVSTFAARAMNFALRIGVWWSAAHPLPRIFLNAVYRTLEPHQRRQFHQRFAKMSRDTASPKRGGIWRIEFHEKEILMP